MRLTFLMWDLPSGERRRVWDMNSDAVPAVGDSVILNRSTYLVKARTLDGTSGMPVCTQTQWYLDVTDLGCSDPDIRKLVGTAKGRKGTTE